MVWRFFFGIKFVNCKQAVDIRVLTVLLNKYRSRYGDYELQFCHFALEANQRNVNTLIASKIIEDAWYDVEFHAHTAFDSAAVIHVLANLRDCSDINMDLSNCGLGDKQIVALTSALAGEHRMLHVKRLNLSACSNKLSDQNLADLFDGASPAFNQSLWYVNLYNNKSIGPKTINSLTRVLAESLLVASELVYGYDDDNDHHDDDDDDDRYTYLDLDNCSLGVDGISALADALCADRLAYLQELSLCRSLTDDANTNAELILALGSGHCSRLKVLDLCRNNLGTPGGKALGKILPRLHSGLSLKLSETMLGDEGISALAQNLNDTVLSELILDSNDIQVAGISRLAESVCTGSIKLYDLFFHLENNPLGLGGVISVVKILTSDHFQPYLTDLSGCQLITAGGIATNPDFLNAVDVQRFICSQQLLITHSFYEFVVDNNNFSGEGIHILAAFMYACPCMKHLLCCSCGITSNDLKQLLILLSELKLKLPYLEWYLQDNDIDDHGVSALIQHLSMFPKLRLVGLYGNTRVSPGMLKTLKENLEKNSSGSDSKGYSTSDSHMIENEDHGEDSLSHTEDSNTEEQYRAAKETGITTVTLKDMGNRPGLSSSEVPSSSKRVRTMEDEGVEQLQLNLVETTTIGAGSESSQQEVVHPSTSSTSTQVQRLDLVLASEHGGVSKHLGQIADAMCEWEGPISEQLGLTEEQYRAAKEAGITTVTLKDMENRTRWSSIEEPPSSKRVRTMEDEGVEQLQSAVLHSASAEATTMEAECESGDQQEVVHLSASSSPATGSSRDCHSENVSPHVADNDEAHVV